MSKSNGRTYDLASTEPTTGGQGMTSQYPAFFHNFFPRHVGTLFVNKQLLFFHFHLLVLICLVQLVLTLVLQTATLPPFFLFFASI